MNFVLHSKINKFSFCPEKNRGQYSFAKKKCRSIAPQIICATTLINHRVSFAPKYKVYNCANCKILKMTILILHPGLVRELNTGRLRVNFKTYYIYKCEVCR